MLRCCSRHRCADRREAERALNVRSGALVGTLAVGRGPIGLALGGPA